MSLAALEALLETMRRLQNTEGLSGGNAFVTFVERWSSVPEDLKTSASLNIFISINDQISVSRDFIESIELRPEAKTGLLSTLNSLQTAFSPTSCNNAVSNIFPALDASISNFSMLVSVLELQFKTRYLSSDMSDVEKELDEIISSLQEVSIDPLVKLSILKSLLLAKTVICNFSILGADAALAAYADVVIRMRNETKKDRDKGDAKSESWFERVANWGKNLQNLVDGFEAGQKIIANARHIAGYLN